MYVSLVCVRNLTGRQMAENFMNVHSVYDCVMSLYYTYYYYYYYYYLNVSYSLF